MTDNSENQGGAPDEMAEYLQTFLDETEEQLDDLVEIMLVLERDPTNHELLNEAFRLIHSIKGAAGIMAFNNITVLTHHLENRFERFRSGTEVLDEPTMNVVLRCIDFVRQCNHQLRDGKELGSPQSLLEELQQLEMHAHSQTSSSPTDEAPASRSETDGPSESDETKPPLAPSDFDAESGGTRMLVRFSAGLQLADLKAQLIVSRLSGLGDIRATHPAAEQLAEVENLTALEVWIQTDESLDGLRAAADVDGVESITFPGSASTPTAGADVTAEPVSDPDDDTDQVDRQSPGPVTAMAAESQSEEFEPPLSGETEPHPVKMDIGATRHADAAQPLADERTTAKVAETMRVDIDRLDNLMNLAGELVVNRARLIQIAGQLSPQLQKGTLLSRIRDVSDVLRRTIDSLEKPSDQLENRSAQIQQLRKSLQLMAEQAEVWEQSRDCFGQISEAIDQLSRVSQNLQRGVLDTRMVPVAPLFHRFKRVVRDLSKERGKRVNLEVRGEKTELDKRMIDELGDPLVHLVRNSIDHGLEGPDVRVDRNKQEEGTI
ncbi:MAG: Hpt domain-containing protein, partial [Bythopirellula sp.]